MAELADENPPIELLSIRPITFNLDPKHGNIICHLTLVNSRVRELGRLDDQRSSVPRIQQVYPWLVEDLFIIPVPEDLGIRVCNVAVKRDGFPFVDLGSLLLSNVVELVDLRSGYGYF